MNKNLFKLTLLSLLFIPACNNAGSTNTIDFDPYTENAFLDFVNNDSIYFDIHVDANSISSINMSIGNQNIVGSGLMSYSSNDEFTTNSIPNGIYYALITEDDSSNTYHSNYGVGSIVESESFVNFFKNVKNYKRAYLFIASNINDWNHSLSLKLNLFLNEKFYPGSGN